MGVVVHYRALMYSKASTVVEQMSSATNGQKRASRASNGSRRRCESSIPRSIKYMRAPTCARKAGSCSRRCGKSWGPDVVSRNQSAREEPAVATNGVARTVEYQTASTPDLQRRVREGPAAAADNGARAGYQTSSTTVHHVSAHICSEDASVHSVTVESSLV